MDGVHFDAEKPAKTWTEAFQQTQSYFVDSLDANFTFAKKKIEQQFMEPD